MRSSYKRLGPFVRPVDVRNRDLKITKLIGVSIQKITIPSIANTVGTNMKNYKIITKNQFVYGQTTSRNGEKISIALYDESDEAIVSQSYTVFEIIDQEKLLPDYLMMWFRRPEFDRYARYRSHGSVREVFDWDEVCDIELPIPSIEKQQEIVDEYNIVVDRIKLNEKLNQKLEETAQAIYKEWFVDFEFPMTKEYAESIGQPELIGKPYKSNGGELVYNEELDRDIPVGWEVVTIKEFTKDMKNGGTPNRSKVEYWNSKDIPWIKSGEVENNILIEAEEYISEKGFRNSSAKLFSKNTVLMALYGATAGQIAHLKFNSTTNQACCGMICEDESRSAYLYYYLLLNQQEIANMSIGGAQANLSKSLVEKLSLLKPKEDILKKQPLPKVINRREVITYEIMYLSNLKDILLSKTSKVER